MIQSDLAQGLAVREALAGWAEDEFQVTWVRDCAAALEWLASAAAGRGAGEDGQLAIVVDLFLSDVKGLETVARLQRAAPRVPLLVMCPRQDEALARQALQCGAQDYLLKEQLDSYLLGKALTSMMQRAAVEHSRHQQEDQARVTLDSIGDAVISSDERGRITYLNGVAEDLTGWTLAGANGLPVEAVLPLIDADSRASVPNPLAQALREDRTVALTRNCILTRRDGREVFIEDSSAPIRDAEGHVIGAVMVCHDVTAARAKSRHMSFLAEHDSLTELPNRLLLEDRLTQALTLARRHPYGTVAVLFVDLDGFKAINDSLGHAIGDLLLRSVSRRLLGCVRSSDTVCRLGGDEFVILLPELAQAADAGAIAEKVLQALRTPHRISDHLLRVTGSIGIATLPDGAVDARRLMENADLAMYQAKARGRNNFQYFEPVLRAPVLERQSPIEFQQQSA